MSLEKEIYEKLIGQEAADAVYQVEQIRTKLSRIRTQIIAEENRHTEAIKELERRRAEVRRNCPHAVTTYIPDASGNNDSWYQCSICGLESRRNFEKKECHSKKN